MNDAQREIAEQVRAMIPRLVDKRISTIRENLIAEVLRRIDFESLSDDVLEVTSKRISVFGGSSVIPRINADTVDFLAPNAGNTVQNLAGSAGASLVGFLPSGSTPIYGWATRTAAAKMSDIVSVEDFKNSDGTQVSASVADNTTGVQAALNKVALTGGKLRFNTLITCASALSLTSQAGIILEGVSPKHQGTLGGSIPRAGLRYTGTAASIFLTFTTCEDIHFDGMLIDYTNAGFSGKLVSFPSTARVSLSRSVLSGDGVTGALYLLELTSCIEFTAYRCSFSGGQYCVFGGNGSNAVTFSGCDFDRYSIAAIYNPYQSWVIICNAFENRIDTLGAAVTMDAGANAYGLEISGNWMGDTSGAGAFTWINLGSVHGFKASANFIDGNANLAGTGIKFNGTSEGIDIKGNYFSRLATGTNLNGFGTTYTVHPNSYTSVTTQIANPITATATNGWYETSTGLVRMGAQAHQVNTPAYGATVAIDASISNYFQIIVSNGNAFTVSNPINLVGALQQTISIKIVNSSGGAMGVITWDTNYRLAAWTNPANGTSRTIDFEFNGAVWAEKSRTTVDVPN